MKTNRYEHLAARQAQWNVFHEWESRKEPARLTTEERIAWYTAALRFSREFSRPRSPGDIESKARQIRELREKLRHLRPGDHE